MVQIIQEKKKPKGPSVGEQLSANLPNVLDMVSQMQQQQQQAKIQQQQQQQQQQAIEKFAPELAGLPPDIQKLGFAEKFKQQSKSAEMAEQLKSNKQPEGENPREIGQKAFNNVVDLLKKGNLGKGSNIFAEYVNPVFGGETSKDVGKFQSSLGGIEAMLVDMVSRGSLTNDRFQYIINTLLPKPDDPEDMIRGKLEGLADILGFDASELTGKKKMGSMKKDRPELKSFLR